MFLQRPEVMMDERRHLVRVGKMAEINYSIADAYLKSGTRSKNISSEGMCLPMIQRLEPGTVLDIEIKLAQDKQPIRAVAQVVWLNPRDDHRYPFEAGVKFIEINETEKAKIKEVLSRSGFPENDSDVRWMER
jgi:c-di-GMP-binding flagellar brake protein YcgR